MFEDSGLRLLIYDEIVCTGETPTVATLARLIGTPVDDVGASLRRMHDAYAGATTYWRNPDGQPVFGRTYAVRQRPK